MINFGIISHMNVFLFTLGFEDKSCLPHTCISCASGPGFSFSGLSCIQNLLQRNIPEGIYICHYLKSICKIIYELCIYYMKNAFILKISNSLLNNITI